MKKQYLCLDKVPVLSRTLQAFGQCRQITQIILVTPQEDLRYCSNHIVKPLNLSTPIHLVAGGKHRQASVFNGLEKALALVCGHPNVLVLVHDGVRPFVDQAIIKDCLDGAMAHGACIPGIPLTDTIKQVTPDGIVAATLDRETMRCAQTPQVFKLDILVKAFEYARQTGFSGTDDAALVEHLGHPVFITRGSKLNIKITTPDDLVFARQILGRIHPR